MNRLAPIFVLLLAAPPVLAGPRDELLRVAPPDAALVVVVQNARGHVRSLIESPFAEWLPSTAIGKKLLSSVDLKQVRDVASNVLPALGTTPQSLLDDVVGDAVAFAYSPAPDGKPAEERAVILIRPGKPEALAKIVEKLNDIQKQSGELKAIVRREHEGAEYFERQKPEGGGEFYCFRNGVFAFSGFEADIKAVIDRDKSAPKDKPPVLVVRMQRLGVADAAVVVLVNPRPLDGEVKAKVAAARPAERRLFLRFEEIWTSVEFAAVSVSLDKNLELGLSLRFHPEKVPADVKKWLIGPRESRIAEALIPTNALLGVAGHARATELLELAISLAPMPEGQPGVKEWVGKTLGAVVGQDKLPQLLESLGPNWAMWAEPPVKDGFLPTVVAAVEVSGEGDRRTNAEKTLLQAVEFGFQTVRVAYNTKHADQIELQETKDATTGVVIKSLVNVKGFPPGFRPSFAMRNGYLVLATSPEAIKVFRVPTDSQPVRDYVTLARISGTQTRAYLLAHGEKLAQFLSTIGMGDEKSLHHHLEGAAMVLELVDSVDLVRHDIENGLKLTVRVKTTKPLKK
ncbi:MAG: hypothetical protein C0467_04395 [Planctomycetaceae bacterium]|nr:hypothetical protein [Planctomycetaceae bacterium]